MGIPALLLTIFGCIFAYLIGSISPSVIISKAYFKNDVRQHYSKNAGATNTSRVLGVKTGFIVLVLDGLKIGLVLGIIKLFTLINNDLNQTSIYVSSIFAVVGHCFPIYHKFKGGKGVGPFLGFALFLNPIYFIIASAIWWTTFLLIRFVSLASLLCALGTFAFTWIMPLNDLPVNMWINHQELSFTYLILGYWTQVIVGIIVIIVWVRHYQNIYRLLIGKEKRYQIRK